MEWFKTAHDWVRRQDFLVLVSMLIAALALWCFLELADEVAEGGTRALDERVIRAFRHTDDPAQAIGPVWVQEAVRDITALGSETILALFIFAVMGFVAIRRQYGALCFLVVSTGGGALLSYLLKQLFERPRPGLVPHLVRVGGTSFPSGHSLASAVVYLTLGALLARLVKPMKLKLYVIGVALFLSFLVGISRTYLGVHYLTDVVAGWTVGLIWAIICWLAARFLQQRGSIEKPTEASS